MTKSDGYAREVLRAGRDLGITPRGIVIGLATCLVEAGPIHPEVPGPIVMYANPKVPESLKLPHDDVSDDGRSVGIFQQQVVWGNNAWWWGDASDCMDPYRSARMFFQRLARRDYNHGDAGAHAQAVQGSAFPDRYAQRMGEAQKLYDRIANESSGGAVSRPDFRESDETGVSPNCNGRGGSKPRYWLLHTQEGNGTAQSLAGFLQNSNSGVSYHYTVDNSVEVVDVVDTDLASWSVLDANPYSINLCFAGSRAAWSRQDWLNNMSRGIDVAAYLAVQDCQKYGIATDVYGPDRYGALADKSGISDHRFVTRALDMGTHTDVGDGFPWDVFASAVARYAGGDSGEELNMDAVKHIEDFIKGYIGPGLSDTKDIREQLCGAGQRDAGQYGGWPQLGDEETAARTVVDGLGVALELLYSIEKRIAVLEAKAGDDK